MSSRPLPAQLVAVLERFDITCVLDVGANLGQYARRLREWGYAGRIVSFEPLPQPYAELERCAATDPDWTIAPRMALGATDGTTSIEVSAESDMSSILPQTALLREVSPSSAILRQETVTLRTLDAVAPELLKPDDRVFLKVDVQGYEAEVLAGAGGLLDRLAGLQLEMPLVPCYQGERAFGTWLTEVATLGFEPYLLLPGYFERKLARQLQVDGVFMRSTLDPRAQASAQ